VRGSKSISFPVFREYSFKAASKTAWNGEEDISRLELPVEDITSDRRMTVVSWR
jgi:hypothetical protein